MSTTTSTPACTETWPNHLLDIISTIFTPTVLIPLAGLFAHVTTTNAKVNAEAVTAQAIATGTTGTTGTTTQLAAREMKIRTRTLKREAKAEAKAEEKQAKAERKLARGGGWFQKKN
ncbi:MAG: hypothetical protein WC208_14345 [Gallionella sp.]|jgi:hypothetical protein